MKKITVLLMVLILLVMYTTNAFAGSVLIDTSRIDEGIVGVEYQVEEGTRYKVMISKENEQYYYDYLGLEKEYFPLQLGNGNYTISVLENISGTKYKLIHKKAIIVEIKEETAVFLQSIQNVNWNGSMQAVSKANILTQGLTRDKDKVEAIYEYVVSNVTYDYKKIGTLETQYVPDVEDTFNTEKGICYDFSALFASMLRSQGIPAKLIKGYSQNVNGYHAWNEVLINGNWITIDTTYDAMMRNYGEDTDVQKNINEYQIARIY